jgi:hypothetical protein
MIVVEKGEQAPVIKLNSIKGRADELKQKKKAYNYCCYRHFLQLT